MLILFGLLAALATAFVLWYRAASDRDALVREFDARDERNRRLERVVAAARAIYDNRKSDDLEDELYEIRLALEALEEG